MSVSGFKKRDTYDGSIQYHMIQIQFGDALWERVGKHEDPVRGEKETDQSLFERGDM
ncbi:hypothetical protein GCM10007416_34810 [Kroppenstedtia guangzhouensis]|uniref:Uncharacterized protein n=1 Tax=Kroppenstedtia guangzhouensis TaxID=1274356 RepID=A0ABQ1H588_9BACL|nr:hypothetical protein GCM10007416_34810 [Kroppenstedtia guangzhouensis]